MSFEGEAELKKALSQLKSSSRDPIEQATKVALKYAKFYKHVVHLCSSHFRKCTTPEMRLAAVFFLDSLLRAARQHPFAQRFEPTIAGSFKTLAYVNLDDFDKVWRCVEYWTSQRFFHVKVLDEIKTVIEDARTDVQAQLAGGGSVADPAAAAAAAAAAEAEAEAQFSDDEDGEAAQLRLAAQQRQLEAHQKRVQAEAASAAARAADGLLARLSTIVPTSLVDILGADAAAAAVAAADAADAAAGNSGKKAGADGAGDANGADAAANAADDESVSGSGGERPAKRPFVPTDPNAPAATADAHLGPLPPPPSQALSSAQTGAAGGPSGAPCGPGGLGGSGETHGYVVTEDQSAAAPGRVNVASTSLFLNTLPPQAPITEADLAPLLQRFGPVFQLRVPRPGMAFVFYRSRRAAVAAFEALAAASNPAATGAGGAAGAGATVVLPGAGPGGVPLPVVLRPSWGRGVRVPKEGFDVRTGYCQLDAGEVPRNAFTESVAGLAYNPGSIPAHTQYGAPQTQFYQQHMLQQQQQQQHGQGPYQQQQGQGQGQGQFAHGHQGPQGPQAPHGQHGQQMHGQMPPQAVMAGRPKNVNTLSAFADADEEMRAEAVQAQLQQRPPMQQQPHYHQQPQHAPMQHQQQTLQFPPPPPPHLLPQHHQQPYQQQYPPQHQQHQQHQQQQQYPPQQQQQYQQQQQQHQQHNYGGR